MAECWAAEALLAVVVADCCEAAAAAARYRSFVCTDRLRHPADNCRIVSAKFACT